MKDKKRTTIINLRIDEKDHQILSELARKEFRAINTQYRMIIGKWINDNTHHESDFIEKERRYKDDLVSDRF